MVHPTVSQIGRGVFPNSFLTSVLRVGPVGRLSGSWPLSVVRLAVCGMIPKNRTMLRLDLICSNVVLLSLKVREPVSLLPLMVVCRIAHQ